MKTVILCEKPDVAKSIAAFLKAGKKNKGYFYNEKYIVTWAFGHLITLENANKYTSDPWDLKNIPIFPETFKYKIYQDKKTQFDIIKKLFLSADKIINATDSGREGELIFRYIYSYSGASVDVFRLWTSSLTDEALETAFQNLKPQKFYDNLFYSALARNHADWLIGINSTVAFTKTLNSYKVLPLGRVQTPTFVAVTRRFIDNKNFKPEDYFVPFIKIIPDNSADKAIKFQYCESFPDKKKSEEFINSLPSTLKCSEYKISETKEKQPLLFDLTSLQMKANRDYKFSAAYTLNIAQNLYEKHKVISYPRCDSRYISDDIFLSLPELFQKLKKLPFYNDYISSVDLKNLPDRSVDNNKITDHHALIPTGILSDSLNSDETKIYNLIIKQFFAAFSGVCLKNNVKVSFEYNENTGFDFSASIIIQEGWRKIFPDKNSFEFIPEFKINKDYKIFNKSLKALKTKAPALFTDSSLLKFMLSCGKDFSSDEIPKEIKQKGIGTPATRAGIIEKIINNQYIERKKNHLIPTEKGLKIYNLIKDFKISSVNLTGNFEEKLFFIEQGKYSYEQFISDIKNLFVNVFFPEIKSLNIKDFVKLKKCPVCGNESLSDNGKFLSCLTSGCDFKMWKEFFKKNLNDTQINELLNMQKVVLKNIKSQKFPGSFFSVEIFLNKEDNYSLSFNYLNNKKKVLDDLLCPLCGDKLTEYNNFFGCSSYNKGCSFSVSKNISEYSLKYDDLKELLKGNKIFRKFKSKKTGKNFKANLLFDDTFKLSFSFDK